MALLDAALRLYGEEEGSQVFALIRDLSIALSPPPIIVVNNCFVRVHKPRRGAAEKAEGASEAAQEDVLGDGPFIRSVAFREYVQYHGPLGIALQVPDQQTTDRLTLLLVQISYLGKRGSLFQIDTLPRCVLELPVRQGYVPVTLSTTDALPTRGSVLQLLDDCAPQLTFNGANIYSDEKPKGRIVRQLELPYRATRSSRGFTRYERLTP
jgi:hypothetical protein